MAPVFLAPEIIGRIIFFLTHFNPPGYIPNDWRLLPDAGQYACVSRFWQDEIEQETFATLRLNLPRLSRLNSIMTPRRRRFVRRFNLFIRLPAPGPRDDPETDDERLRNNQALQATLEAFLLTLSQWTAAEVHQDGIKLYYFANLPREERPPSPMPQPRVSAWVHRYKKSVLELTDPERIAQLPPVIAITELMMNQRPLHQRRMSVVAISSLLAKLPAAKFVQLDWWKAVRFARMRNGNSGIKDLANTLFQIKHPIENFTLCDSVYTPDQAWPSRISERLWQGEDRLSESIRILSQRVKVLVIEDIAINDEIFYPRALSVGLTEPRWNQLVYLRLHYLPIDPSGELLFLPDPNEAESYDSEASVDSDASGNMPEITFWSLSIATPAIQKLHLAAARAVLQMPALREMELEASLGNDDHWHQFWYQKGESSAKAIWTSNSGWIPEDDVLECWRKVPRKHWNMELKVTVSNDKHAVFFGSKPTID
ncbi:hypothetical protein TrVFT333_006418 [Trichoderma virens FT-333]|nr:hypothetical protein TrVFT333_006418 [Trichoderma virens FT-333]